MAKSKNHTNHNQSKILISNAYNYYLIIVICLFIQIVKTIEMVFIGQRNTDMNHVVV